MTDRFPLVVASGSVQELPSGDSLDLTDATIKVSAGSSSSPTIYPSGDTNTGIFFPAADTVSIGVGGTEEIRITPGGVGINTAPVQGTALRVVGGVNLDGVGVAASSHIVLNPGFTAPLGISTTTVTVTFGEGNGPVIIASDVIVSASLSTGTLLLMGGGFLPLTNNQKVVTEIHKQNVLGVAYTNTTTKVEKGFRFQVGITTGENRQINVMVLRSGSSGDVNISFASTIT